MHADDTDNRDRRTHRFYALVAILVFLAVTALPLASSAEMLVGGQPVPARTLTATAGAFEAADDAVVMHYYGVGGWGIQWRGEYLLLAPYFTRYRIPALLRSNSPDLSAIRKGADGTPFKHAGLVLVGHGHVDHAADIPGYFDAGLASGQAGLVGNHTTVNMLDSLVSMDDGFRCAQSPAYDGEVMDDCALEGFRIRAIASDHAPNVKLFGSAFLVSEGHLESPQQDLPRRPMDYLAGDTWAYLIDMLDPDGNVVFRIHYMDAVAGAGQSHLPPELIAQHSVDIHIACVPGFDYVDGYPEWALQDGNARYTMLGHWEDFFGGDSDEIKPVRFVLNERKLNQFKNRVENASAQQTNKLAPTNKGAADCPVEQEICGPRGDSWAMPVPGETFRFSPLSGN